MRLVCHLIGLAQKQIVLVDHVNLNLFVDKVDDVLYDRICGDSKIFGRRIIGVNHALHRARKQRFGSTGVLHEIENKGVIKVRIDLRLVLKAEPVVQFRKFEHNLDCFWLVGPAQTAVLFSAEDAFAALEDQMGTNGVLFAVLTHLPLAPVLLLGQQDYRAEIPFAFLLLAAPQSGIVGQDRVSDVGPNVGRVIPVQIHDRLFKGHFPARGTFTLGRDLVEIVLVGLRANRVNDLVEGHVGVFGLVGIREIAEDPIITDLLEVQMGQSVPVDGAKLALQTLNGLLVVQIYFYIFSSSPLFCLFINLML